MENHFRCAHSGMEPNLNDNYHTVYVATAVQQVSTGTL